MTAPLIGPVDIGKYLAEGQIEQVICGGENYDGSRLCRYEWVKLLSEPVQEIRRYVQLYRDGHLFRGGGKGIPHSG